MPTESICATSPPGLNCVDKNGTVYTSESGPNRIKRYTTDGKFLGLVGELGKPIRNSATMASSCSNTAVAVNADGSHLPPFPEIRDQELILPGRQRPP